VGDPVTLSALGHVDLHVHRMRFSVASTTSRDFFVCGVTISAQDVAVLGRTALEQVIHVSMTAGTDGRRRVLGIRDLRWFVDRMA
jgi:hypothetical protein